MYNPALYLFFFVALGLMACEKDIEYNSCAPPGDSIFVSAVIAELERQGVENYIETERGMVCTTSDYFLEMNRAAGNAQQYYKGAAIIIYNSNQKSRIIQYLKMENRKFTLSPSENGKEFLVVHSGSKVELEETRTILKKLSASQCANGKMPSNNRMQTDSQPATPSACR